MSSSRKIPSGIEEKKTTKEIAPTSEKEKTPLPGVAAPFIRASEKYATSVATLVGEVDKKLVPFCKSVDEELSKIKLTDDLENINKQIKKLLEKLKKGTDAIVHDINVPGKFKEFYNLYYTDIGAAWSRLSGNEITPGELGGILENIVVVQQVSLYLNSLFVIERAK